MQGFRSGRSYQCVGDDSSGGAGARVGLPGFRSGRTPIVRCALGLFLVMVLATLFAAGGLAASSGSSGSRALAATAYRYWGFFQWQKGSWHAATKGAAQVTPKDGAVDGWRYAISADKPRPPRNEADFASICGSTPAQDGKKRVAVVLDYGITTEAPSGQQPPKLRGACALVAPSATSDQVLAAAAQVREQKGMVCAIDAYPRTGCSDAVANPPAVKLPEQNVPIALPAGASGGTSGPVVWAITGVAIVVVIVLAGFVTRTRRRSGGAGSDAAAGSEAGAGSDAAAGSEAGAGSGSGASGGGSGAAESGSD